MDQDKVKNLIILIVLCAVVGASVFFMSQMLLSFQPLGVWKVVKAVLAIVAVGAVVYAALSFIGFQASFNWVWAGLGYVVACALTALCLLNATSYNTETLLYRHTLIVTDDGQILRVHPKNIWDVYILKEGSYEVQKQPIVTSDYTVNDEVAGIAYRFDFRITVEDMDWYAKNLNFNFDSVLPQKLNHENMMVFSNKKALTEAVCAQVQPLAGGACPLNVEWVETSFSVYNPQ